MINPLLDGGAEINPFTNYISTKRKLINVWLLIKMLPLSVFFLMGMQASTGNMRLPAFDQNSKRLVTETTFFFPDILHQLHHSYPVSRVSGNAINYLSVVAKLNVMAGGYVSVKCILGASVRNVSLAINSH